MALLFRARAMANSGTMHSSEPRPSGVASRGEPGWAKVHWAANDEDSTDYRHIANSPLKGTPFEFTPDDLELLIKANAFEPLRDRGKIIFALRGAELVVSGAASADDKFRQVGRAVLNLRETRPDHQHFRCVIGVYDVSQRQLSAFHRLDGALPPGCLQLCQRRRCEQHAPHRLLPDGGRHSQRPHRLPYGGRGFHRLAFTTKDYVFDTKDTWDNTFPGDDLHPAFANYSAEFSSWGCQTIRGDCPPGTDRFSGEYKEFRQALGLKPGTADHGAKFSYVAAHRTGGGDRQQAARWRLGAARAPASWLARREGARPAAEARCDRRRRIRLEAHEDAG